MIRPKNRGVDAKGKELGFETEHQATLSLDEPGYGEIAVPTTVNRLVAQKVGPGLVESVEHT